ncbi:DEAD/DEAH box helicase [Desulfobacter sp.]
MIPSVLAHHVEQGIKDFIRTTFPVTTPYFSSIIERFLSEPGVLFKGPYVDIQLPFQTGKTKEAYFPNLGVSFTPYLHQEKAFDRLSASTPGPTIIATGTGSGKTECFLHPILDYCFQHRGEPGIKAILIYPMNALATDQAGRIARLIHNSPLKDQVTAGIFVGQQEKEPAMLMRETRLISDKETLRLSPPDILVTNYKMLDYLLIRPEDRKLWHQNSPDTLKFLVVDELHTFDGAQGADLGCLIRRLKSRLDAPRDGICGIGTSATLGSSEERQALLEYAASVFGQPFDEDSIISESRISAGEFLGDSLVSQVDVVPPEKIKALDPGGYDTHESYIRAQHQLWFDEAIPEEFDDPQWKVALGTRLKEHLFFQNLLKILKGEICGMDDILERLERVTRALKHTKNTYRRLMLNSLLAMVSEARIKSVAKDKDGGEAVKFKPFLHVRVQLWLRELRRMVASVGPSPGLRFADDLHQEQLKTHLPLVHCRECGSMGWAGLKRMRDAEIRSELRDFYLSFFNRDPQVVYLFPEDESLQLIEEAKPTVPSGSVHKVGRYYLCPRCLHVTTKDTQGVCPFCEHESLILVHMPDVRVQKGNRTLSHNDCPYCNAKNSLTLLGSRAASLTSVMIVQLYSSTYNDDKKLLTFSDNVQDAAHRAGFFNGRTYRFNFRIALQKMIQEKGEGRSLSELPALFSNYWLDRTGQNRYIATFLAPNMEWLQEYDEFLKKKYLPEDSTLLLQIHDRVGWEIFSEYGFRTRIGRTLEKTSSSVAYLDPERLDALVADMLEPIQNEIGGLKDLETDHLKTFLLGLIVHLKNQGGIYQPYLKTFIESFGSAYLLNRVVWMPNFGQASRTPAFLTSSKGRRFDQLLSRKATHRTWYETWAEKCLHHVFIFIPEVTTPLYDIVIKSLVDSGIFEETPVKGEKVWGINPGAMKVTSQVRQFRCARCEHNISVAQEEAAFFEGAPCQRFHCWGQYRQVDTGVDYYGSLYATGDVERIFAREHTGLLHRTERESLEQNFKAEEENRYPWYPNLLSCTPTLEMGIDIGDLSSLVLCSVPPAQANYLQRVGRAGRQDGNALSLTVANARPHDLFFFSEPGEMLAGHIDPPGIFLDASAVLERQFTAFCFDRWIAHDPAALIPPKLGNVLNNLSPVDQKKFPHNFIHFIETRQADLFTRFLEMFKNGEHELSPESRKNLQGFVQGDGQGQLFLRGRIMSGLHSRYKERESLRKKVQILNGKIRKMKKGPKDKNFDTALRELMIEKSALQSLGNSISNRNTFNFFTDEGLLPNYAFPEAGVILNSLIYRKKTKIQDGEGSSYDTWNFEYERPARSAINELAPANTFYAEGRKVKIDQVDLEVSEIENWRFCDRCAYKELVTQDTPKEACPCCGSPMWADAGQQRKMLRMRQVFASTSDRQSRISDDADDREPVFYNKQMLVAFEEDKVMQAYKVDTDFPFGFDFLSKVDFCEINFGEKTEKGEKLSIAGIEMPRKGFSICKNCGKVQDDFSNETAHALTCTARNQTNDKHLIDCLYLYRQFVSEAIRILLPVSIISESDRKLHSFIAAIQLGLKKKFKGKIDHLQTALHEEPLPESNFKRKYLILYDTVPGGTGYLKQLMQSEKELLAVLELAIDALKSCPCVQEEGKDGCYRCLFAYRSSYHMTETSRDTAIEILAEILSYKDQLVKVGHIHDISMNTYIESELEARFIGALKKAGSARLPVQLENDLVNGKPGYFFKVKDRAYYIEPQVELGELDGVSVFSRVDFLIRPARLSDAMKPVAIFLDGFAHHQNRLGKDTAQRMAIAHSNKYRMWSLTWRDVENQFKSQNGYYEDFMAPDKFPSGGNFQNLLDIYDVSQLKKMITLNSFDLLLKFLENPDEGGWKKLAFVASLLHADVGRFNNEKAISQWKKDIKDAAPITICEKMMEAGGQCFYGDYRFTVNDGSMFLHGATVIEQEAMPAPGITSGAKIFCFLDDKEAFRSASEFLSVWNGFLRLYNYYQFLPCAYFVTSEGVKHQVYEGLKLLDPLLPEPGDTQGEGDHDQESAESWKEAEEYIDPLYLDLLGQFKKASWPPPKTGYELVGENGEIIASAEIGWEDLKLGLLTDMELPGVEKFKAAGWKTIPIEDVVADPDSYMDMKNKDGE